MLTQVFGAAIGGALMAFLFDRFGPRGQRNLGLAVVAISIGLVVAAVLIIGR